MNESIKMSVSSMTRNGDNKAVYVLFSDEDKAAEFSLPGCKIISNRGFDAQEIEQLKLYVDNEQDYIFGLAKDVNPVKAFMGENHDK